MLCLPYDKRHMERGFRELGIVRNHVLPKRKAECFVGIVLIDVVFSDHDVVQPDIFKESTFQNLSKKITIFVTFFINQDW